MNNSIGVLGALNAQNPPRCECHECMRIRWQMSIHGQQAGLAEAAQQNISQALEEYSRRREALQNKYPDNGGM